MFTPLADWKVQLLSMGIFEERSRRLLCCCWVVVRRSDWMTRPTQYRVLYQSKTSSIVTSWSSHHCAISHHHCTIKMMSHALQSLLDWSFPVSGYFSGKYHALFITWSFSIMLYHPFSHTMSYAPILTYLRTNFFPMTSLSLCLCWFIHSHDPLYFLNDLTNCFHPPSCLCLLLLFYLWFVHLWSSTTATVLVLKLY